MNRIHISTRTGGLLLSGGLLFFFASLALAVLYRPNDSALTADPADSTGSLDPADAAYLERFGEELKTDIHERQALKSANESTAEHIHELERRLATLTGSSASGVAISATQLQGRIAGVQTALVAVVPAIGSAGTGFLYRMNETTTVLTTLAPNAQSASILIQFYSEPDHHDKSTFVSLPATPVYADSESGICVLTANFGESIAALHPLNPADIKTAASGDRVYALALQMQPDSSLVDAIFDGNISAIDRKIGARTFFQVAVGFEDSIRGAPLVSPSGELVGMMAPALDAIERTQFAFKASDFSAAMQFASTSSAASLAANPVTKTLAQQNNIPASNSIRLARPADNPRLRTLPPQRGIPPIPAPPAPVPRTPAKLPYQLTESIPCAGVPRLFAGADNSIVVWDPVRFTLASYRAGQTTAAWQIEEKSSRDCVCVEREGHVLLIEPTSHVGKEISLESGHVLRENLKLSRLFGSSVYRVGESFITSDTGSAIIDPIADTRLALGGGKVLAIRNEQLFEFVGANFQVYNFMARALRQRENNRAEKELQDCRSTDSNVIKQLVSNLIRAREAVRTSDLRHITLRLDDFNPTARSLKIGDSNRYLVDRHILELTDAGEISLAGVLKRPDAGTATDNRFKYNGPMLAVSPDGKYAVSAYLVYSLETRERIADLPLFIRDGVFSSDGTLFYSYDETQCRIYALKTDDLIPGKH